MKWLWITLGIVFVVCCGGGSLIGYIVYNNAKGVSDDAGKFGDASITAICTNWDANALNARAAPELLDQNPEGTLEKVVDTLRNSLGPMKSFTSHITNLNAKTENGQSWVEVQMVANGQFEKGPGEIELTLLKRGDKWSILKFYGGPEGSNKPASSSSSSE